MISQNSNIKDQNQDKKSKMEVKYRAFYLSLEIIKFISHLQPKMEIRIICDQLIRSITSIGANIVEAKSSSSKREFLNYFQIALKSCNESKYWLALLRELSTEKETLQNFVNEADQIGKILGSSILTMKGKKL